VLVTGANGYLGSWCCQKALEAGFTVVGTVRDPDGPKAAFLKEAVQGESSKLSTLASTKLNIVRADLLDSIEAWQTIFLEHNVKYVMHTASPTTTVEPNDPNDILRPAVDGTSTIMQAAISCGVSRVVMTSSGAAVWDPITEGKVYTHTDWSDPDKQTSTYFRSKTLAERTAWDAIHGTGTELCTVIPYMILGPTLFNDASLLGNSDSLRFAASIATGDVSAVPDMTAGVCDVRDVAQVHVRALTEPDAAGKRFICCTQTIKMKELQAKLAKAAGRSEAAVMPACIFGCVALCSSDARMVKDRLGKSWEVDASQTKEVLKLQFTPFDGTVRSIIDDFVTLQLITASAENDEVQRVP